MLLFAAEVAAGFLTFRLEQLTETFSTLSLPAGLAADLSGGLEWSAEYAGLLTFFLRAAYEGTPGFADPLVHPVGQALQALLRKGARERGELREDVDLDLAVRLVGALTTPVIDADLVPHLNDCLQLFDFGTAEIHAGTVRFIVRAIS